MNGLDNNIQSGIFSAVCDMYFCSFRFQSGPGARCVTELKTDAKEFQMMVSVLTDRVQLFKSINFLVAFTMYSFGDSLGMPRKITDITSVDLYLYPLVPVSQFQ